MALTDYARPNVVYKGSPLVQITSATMTTNSGLQRVDLLTEGLGGFTPGPGDVSIALGVSVPVAGFEQSFQQDCANGEFVTIQYQVGGEFYIGIGKVQDFEVSGSTGANTEGSLNWLGELKPMEE